MASDRNPGMGRGSSHVHYTRNAGLVNKRASLLRRYAAGGRIGRNPNWIPEGMLPGMGMYTLWTTKYASNKTVD